MLSMVFVVIFSIAPCSKIGAVENQVTCLQVSVHQSPIMIIRCTDVLAFGVHIFNNTLANGCYKLHKSTWGEVCLYVGVGVGGGGVPTVLLYSWSYRCNISKPLSHRIRKHIFLSFVD